MPTYIAFREDDLTSVEGQKIRISSDYQFFEELDDAGGVPVQVAFAEVYVALQTGVIDGVLIEDDQLSIYEAASIEEVAPYVYELSAQFELSERGLLSDLYDGSTEPTEPTEPTEQATSTMRPSMATRPFQSSADLVRPVSMAGMRPAAGSSASPSSRKSLSWKESGAMVAQTDIMSAWMWPMRMTARPLVMVVLPAMMASVPHSLRSRGLSKSGMRPWA